MTVRFVPGTGILDPRGKARYISQRANTYSGNLPIYSYVCYPDQCTVPGSIVGRLVDIIDLGGVPTKVFAMSSECHGGTFSDYVMHNIQAPSYTPQQSTAFGFSNVLRVVLQYALLCAEDCRFFTGELTFVPGVNRWEGTIPLANGNLNIVIFNQFDAGLGYSTFFVSFSGCVTAGPFEALVECLWPLKLHIVLPDLPSTCCDVLPGAFQTIVEADVYGFTHPTGVARYVDDLSGTKVFAISECCEPCLTLPCCDDGPIPMQLTVTVLSNEAACAGSGTMEFTATGGIWPGALGTDPNFAWFGVVTLSNGNKLLFWLYCSTIDPEQLLVSIGGTVDGETSCYLSAGVPYVGTCASPISFTSDPFVPGSSCCPENPSASFQFIITE